MGGPGSSRGAGFDRRHLLLGLVPIAVYIALYVVLGEVRPDGIRFTVVRAEDFPSLAALEARYRYLWVSAFLLSAAVSLTVAVSAAIALRTETPARDRRLIFALVAAVAALIVGNELLPNLRPDRCAACTSEWWCAYVGRRWYEYMGEVMGEGLYCFVFDPPPGRPDSEPVLWMLDIGLDVVKAFGAVALVLIAAALILTLTGTDRTVPPDRHAEHLASALGRQRLYLQQGAAVYVFALIAMLSWMYWPLPYLAGEDTREAYRQLVVGAALVQGVGYSLGIAAIYLPPALLLRRRVVDLAAEAAGDAVSGDDWLRKKGLETQPLDQLRQVAALLMPTLISVLPALRELWQ